MRILSSLRYSTKHTKKPKVATISLVQFFEGVVDMTNLVGGPNVAWTLAGRGHWSVSYEN